MAVCGVDSLLISGEGDNESSNYMTYFALKKVEEDGRFTLLVELPLKETVENTDDMPFPFRSSGACIYALPCQH